MEEIVEIEELCIRLYRQNRKTLVVRVRGAQVIAYAPVSASATEIVSIIGRRLNWLRDRLADNRATEHAVRGLNGLAEIILGGESHPVTELVKGRVSKSAVMRVYAKAFESASARTEQLANTFGFTFSPPVKISNAKTSWGSCSTGGIIRLNFRAVMLPGHLLDYILLHELMHTVHSNHSKAFWTALARVMSDYKERRKALKGFAYLMYAYR